MTAYRLDPPGGSSMHWSRTVDLPLALLITLFERFTDRAMAETLTRLVFPLALLLGLFAGMARLARILFGPTAMVPAIVATLLCGCAIVQFQPGRIDHHAPQIVALVFMVAAALAALDPAKARQGLVAGLLIGLSLSISLENLPFVVCLCGMLVAIWIWHGAIMNRMLRAFALGLGGGLALFYAATVGPDRWFAPVCDAFGIAHLQAGLVGAAGCFALASAPALTSRMRRLGAGLMLGALVIGGVALLEPTCLHDPFAKVDPLVRTIWMANVTESQPFTAFYAKDRTAGLLFVLPVVLGLAGCLVAALRLRGPTALRFGVLAALTATGLAMAFWQIRVFTSVTPIALCGALPLAITLHALFKRQARDLAALLALGLILPFTSLAWAMVLPDEAAPAPVHGNACLAPQSFAALTALPAGATVAPIDSGAFLLVHTGLSVFAAPYHRDNDGNRFALEMLLAAPDRAVAGLAAYGVTYLMVCPDLGESRRLAERAPSGLIAALLAGRVPPGLAPLAIAATPYRVYRVDPRGMP